MSLSVFETFRKQKMKKSLFLWLLILSAFYAFVCTPIFHLCSSNILLRDSVYPIVLDFLMSFLNYLFYWIAFSFLIYAFHNINILSSTVFIASPKFSSLVHVLFRSILFNLHIQAYFNLLHFIVLHRSCIFIRLKVCGNLKSLNLLEQFSQQHLFTSCFCFTFW